MLLLMKNLIFKFCNFSKIELLSIFGNDSNGSILHLSAQQLLCVVTSRVVLYQVSASECNQGRPMDTLRWVSSDKYGTCPQHQTQQYI